MEKLLTIEKRQSFIDIIRCGMDIDVHTGDFVIDDYDEFIQLSIRQSLQSIVYRGLKKYGAPSELLHRFDKTRLKDTRLYVLQNDSLNRISNALAENNIQHIPLKGAVIRQLYPEPEIRTCLDIDLLVHESDLDKAIKIIENKTDFKVRKRNYHDISMVNSNVHLELHFNIKENIETIDKLLDRVWDYAVPDDSYRYKLNPEFLIFHVVAHMSYHMIHAGLGIRPFLDLWLLRNKTKYDEETVRLFCDECNILVFYEKCCELVDSWMLNTPIPESLMNLEECVFNGGVFGSKENSDAVRQREYRGISYYFHRVFMSRKLLELEYPELKSKPHYLPFFQIRRWMRLLSSQKRKQVSNEIKSINSINRETVDSFDRLLSSLGL